MNKVERKWYQKFCFIFQDAGLGVDQGTKAPKERYLPPHLRGKSGGRSDEHPPPDSGRNNYDDRGGRGSNYGGRSGGGRYDDRSYNRDGYRDRNDQGRGKSLSGHSITT